MQRGRRPVKGWRRAVKPALVHYYFPSMGDLLRAVLSEGAEANLADHRNAIRSEIAPYAERSGVSNRASWGRR